MLNNDFYSGLEEGMREVVYKLRNAGINTTCSCEHEGIIECDSHDAQRELDTVYNVLVEMGIKHFTVHIRAEYTPNFYHRFLEIQSEEFIKKE